MSEDTEKDIPQGVCDTIKKTLFHWCETYDTDIHLKNEADKEKYERAPLTKPYEQVLLTEVEFINLCKENYIIPSEKLTALLHTEN